MSAEIYDYEGRIQRCRRLIKNLRSGELVLTFLDHLTALGLSTARVAAYAGHLPAILRAINFDLREAEREDAERVVAWVNSQPYRESTKRDKKIVLRELIQYAKYGCCDRNTPLPGEVKWISLRAAKKDVRVTPDNLLTPEDFEAIVKAADNTRDRALVQVLFEAALRRSVGHDRGERPV